MPENKAPRGRRTKRRDSAPTYSIFSQVVAAFAHPAVITYLTAQSERNRIRSWTRPAKTFWQHDYSGEKILLLALYQKGNLRPDTVRMLKAAKEAGLYVLACNTLRLQEPQAYDGLIDCYSERYNFGRDFGSYRHAFLHLYKQGWDKTCPRLMMLNDSVYCTKDQMPAFLDEMMTSEVEVLGSTENYEINYHLGSFCIAMAGSVLRNPKLKRYWRRFKLSDVRPRVIKRGEMGLSKVLARCASDPSQFRALYDSLRYARALRDADDSRLDDIVAMTRKSDLTPARRFSIVEQIETFEQEFTRDIFDEAELSVERIPMDELSRQKLLVDSYSNLKDAVGRRLRTGNNASLGAMRETVISSLIDNFRQHSQIHQNATLLLKMGLPIVKLDGVYRGMFNMADVTRIIELLRPDERQELERILMSRPFGGDVLIGWRRAAFMRGLI